MKRFRSLQLSQTHLFFHDIFIQAVEKKDFLFGRINNRRQKLQSNQIPVIIEGDFIKRLPTAVPKDKSMKLLLLFDL